MKPNLSSRAPTLTRVLSALPDERKAIMFKHSQQRGFHRGRQWFGHAVRVKRGESGAMAFLGTDYETDYELDPCPVAAAFHVQRDTSPSGWYSAKLDENLLAAIRHIVEAAGDAENGMEQYLKELESCDPVELHDFIEAQYLATVSQKQA